MLLHVRAGWRQVIESITDGSGAKRLKTLNETVAQTGINMDKHKWLMYKNGEMQ